MTTWIGATLVAVIVALCVACAQQSIQPMPRIEDKIDRDAYNPSERAASDPPFVGGEGGPT